MAGQEGGEQRAVEEGDVVDHHHRLAAGRNDVLAAAQLDAVEQAQQPGGDALHQLGRQQLADVRSEEHTSELQSLMRNSYAVFFLQKKTTTSNAYKLSIID